MATEQFSTIESNIGLVGATALVVGNVIGVSVFILPAPLAGDAGPSVVLAVLTATIPLIFGMLMTLQLGGAIPVAGGGYVYGSRLVAPFWGFLTPWVAVPGVWAGLLFTGIGFAEYVGFFVDVPELVLIYTLLIPFLLINLLGIRLVATVQFVMVSVLLLGMLSFIVPGAFQVDPGNYTPLFPKGVAPFIAATVSLYFPLRGFSLVIELGEEIENPIENIPRVLLLSGVVSVSLMVGLIVVLVGVENWQTLGSLDAGVATVSESFLPGWATALIVVAAVLGAFTSINTTYTGFSRAIMRAARDELVPGQFADIHPRWDTPHWSVLLLGVPPLLIAPVAPSPVVLSIALALAILLGVFVGAFALWNLPKKYPQRYEYSIYKLPKPLLVAVVVGAAVSSGLLILGLSTEMPWMVGLLALWIAIGYVVFRLRIRQLERRGVDLQERMSKLHADE